MIIGFDGWIGGDLGVLECTVSDRSIYDRRIALVNRKYVSRCANGFVAMEAAVARISNRSEGTGAV